jgi:hypothetical protein
MTMRVGVAFGLVGMLALATITACGDDDDDSGGGTTTTAAAPADTTTGGTAAAPAEGTEEEYVAAVTRTMTNNDPDELQLTTEQADCLAPKWIDTIGVDRLKEQGVAPDDIGDDPGDSDLSDLGLTDEEGGELYDAFAACDVDIREEFIATLSAESEMSEEAASCIGDAFDEGLLRRIMVASITKGDAGLEADPDLAADFQAAITQCAELIEG